MHLRVICIAVVIVVVGGRGGGGGGGGGWRCHGRHARLDPRRRLHERHVALGPRARQLLLRALQLAERGPRAAEAPCGVAHAARPVAVQDKRGVAGAGINAAVAAAAAVVAAVTAVVGGVVVARNFFRCCRRCCWCIPFLEVEVGLGADERVGPVGFQQDAGFGSSGGGGGSDGQRGGRDNSGDDGVGCRSSRRRVLNGPPRMTVSVNVVIIMPC